MEKYIKLWQDMSPSSPNYMKYSFNDISLVTQRNLHSVLLSYCVAMVMSLRPRLNVHAVFISPTWLVNLSASLQTQLRRSWNTE